MNMNWLPAAAIGAMALTAAAGAQSGADMGKPSMNDKMNVVYTGCVANINHGGTFLLTNATDTGAKPEHDHMAMKDAAAMMKKDDAKMDPAASQSIVLAGSDLKKHVGQKVSVTGTLSHGPMGTMEHDRSTLTVSALKVVAKSCS